MYVSFDCLGATSLLQHIKKSQAQVTLNRQGYPIHVSRIVSLSDSFSQVHTQTHAFETNMF